MIFGEEGSDHLFGNTGDGSPGDAGDVIDGGKDRLPDGMDGNDTLQGGPAPAS